LQIEGKDNFDYAGGQNTKRANFVKSQPSSLKP